MTTIIVDLHSAGHESHPDDKVKVWSPINREGTGGVTVSTAVTTIALVDGQGQQEVEPGPLMIQLQCRGISDTASKEVNVPDQASVSLWELLEQVFEYEPPVGDRVVQDIIDALNAALVEIGAAKRPVISLTDEDLNSITIPGDYAQSAAWMATAARNYPFEDRFSIHVLDPNTVNPNQKTQFLVGANTRKVAIRDLYGSTWSDWEIVGDTTARELGDADLNSIRIPAPYAQSASSKTTPERNYPFPERGALLILDPNPINPNQKIQMYISSASNRVAIRNLYGAIWSPWRELGGGEGSSLSGHAIGTDGPHRKNEMILRKGGAIGTGGRGVIALRFDHQNPDFQEKVLPLLKARGLPYTHAQFAMALDPSGSDRQAGLTWPQVQSASLNQGGEIFSHSYTHQDTTDYHREIVESRDYLEAQMPEIRVDGFAQPGIPGTAWEGMALNLSNPAQWRDYEAGRLIRDSYGIYTGTSVLYWPLAGGGADGIPYTALDNVSSPASAINIIDTVANTGMGGCLMFHPHVLGMADRLSTATWTAILDHLVAKRDAGEIMVLTISGMSVAVPYHSHRTNLLESSDFADPSKWQGTTGWSFAGGVASTTTGGVILRNMDPVARRWAQGGAYEALAEFRAPQGAVVSVRAYDYNDPARLDSTRTVTLPASEEWVAVRQPILIPRLSTLIRFEGGRVSGGTVEMRAPGFYAI